MATTAPISKKQTASLHRLTLQVGSLVVFWTPRALIAGFAGYSCLGIAYEWRVMAAIDQIAIGCLKQWGGYAGIGAFMPLVQWYSAWGVRIAAALTAGIAYDLAARIALRFWLFMKASFSTDRSQLAAMPCPV